MQSDKPGKATGRPTRTLRQRAEEISKISPTDLSSMSDQDIERLVYELQIHQVELELQNEQLREAQTALACSLDRFRHLFDFFPVGYLTLDSAGIILEANLTVALQLGVDRGQLPGSKFSHYVAPGCQDAAYLHWQEVFESTQRQICDLEFHRADDQPVFLRLESIRLDAPGRRGQECRVALIDISDTRRAQHDLKVLNSVLEQRVAAQVGGLPTVL